MQVSWVPVRETSGGRWCAVQDVMQLPPHKLCELAWPLVTSGGSQLSAASLPQRRGIADVQLAFPQRTSAVVKAATLSRQEEMVQRGIEQSARQLSAQLTEGTTARHAPYTFVDDTECYALHELRAALLRHGLQAMHQEAEQCLQPTLATARGMLQAGNVENSSTLCNTRAQATVLQRDKPDVLPDESATLPASCSASAAACNAETSINAPCTHAQTAVDSTNVTGDAMPSMPPRCSLAETQSDDPLVRFVIDDSCSISWLDERVAELVKRTMLSAQYEESHGSLVHTAALLGLRAYYQPRAATAFCALLQHTVHAIFDQLAVSNSAEDAETKAMTLRLLLDDSAREDTASLTTELGPARELCLYVLLPMLYLIPLVRWRTETLMQLATTLLQLTPGDSTSTATEDDKEESDGCGVSVRYMNFTLAQRLVVTEEEGSGDSDTLMATANITAHVEPVPSEGISSSIPAVPRLQGVQVTSAPTAIAAASSSLTATPPNVVTPRSPPSSRRSATPTHERDLLPHEEEDEEEEEEESTLVSSSNSSRSRRRASDTETATAEPAAQLTTTAPTASDVDTHTSAMSSHATHSEGAAAEVTERTTAPSSAESEAATGDNDASSSSSSSSSSPVAASPLVRRTRLFSYPLPNAQQVTLTVQEAINGDRIALYLRPLCLEATSAALTTTSVEEEEDSDAVLRSRLPRHCETLSPGASYTCDGPCEVIGVGRVSGAKSPAVRLVATVTSALRVAVSRRAEWAESLAWACYFVADALAQELQRGVWLRRRNVSGRAVRHTRSATVAAGEGNSDVEDTTTENASDGTLRVAQVKPVISAETVTPCLITRRTEILFRNGLQPQSGKSPYALTALSTSTTGPNSPLDRARFALMKSIALMPLERLQRRVLCRAGDAAGVRAALVCLVHHMAWPASTATAFAALADETTSWTSAAHATSDSEVVGAALRNWADGVRRVTLFGSELGRCKLPLKVANYMVQGVLRCEASAVQIVDAVVALLSMRQLTVRRLHEALRERIEAAKQAHALTALLQGCLRLCPTGPLIAAQVARLTRLVLRGRRGTSTTSTESKNDSEVHDGDENNDGNEESKEQDSDADEAGSYLAPYRGCGTALQAKLATAMEGLIRQLLRRVPRVMDIAAHTQPATRLLIAPWPEGAFVVLSCAVLAEVLHGSRRTEAEKGIRATAYRELATLLHSCDTCGSDKAEAVSLAITHPVKEGNSHGDDARHSWLQRCLYTLYAVPFAFATRRINDDSDDDATRATRVRAMASAASVCSAQVMQSYLGLPLSMMQLGKATVHVEEFMVGVTRKARNVYVSPNTPSNTSTTPATTVTSNNSSSSEGGQGGGCTMRPNMPPFAYSTMAMYDPRDMLETPPQRCVEVYLCGSPATNFFIGLASPTFFLQDRSPAADPHGIFFMADGTVMHRALNERLVPPCGPGDVMGFHFLSATTPTATPWRIALTLNHHTFLVLDAPTETRLVLAIGVAGGKTHTTCYRCVFNHAAVPASVLQSPTTLTSALRTATTGNAATGERNTTSAATRHVSLTSTPPSGTANRTAVGDRTLPLPFSTLTATMTSRSTSNTVSSVTSTAAIQPRATGAVVVPSSQAMPAHASHGHRVRHREEHFSEAELAAVRRGLLPHSGPHSVEGWCGAQPPLTFFTAFHALWLVLHDIVLLRASEQEQEEEEEEMKEENETPTHNAPTTPHVDSALTTAVVDTTPTVTAEYQPEQKAMEHVIRDFCLLVECFTQSCNHLTLGVEGDKSSSAEADPTRAGDAQTSRCALWNETCVPAGQTLLQEVLADTVATLAMMLMTASPSASLTILRHFGDLLSADSVQESAKATILQALQCHLPRVAALFANDIHGDFARQLATLWAQCVPLAADILGSAATHYRPRFAPCSVPDEVNIFAGGRRAQPIGTTSSSGSGGGVGTRLNAPWVTLYACNGIAMDGSMGHYVTFSVRLQRGHSTHMLGRYYYIGLVSRGEGKAERTLTRWPGRRSDRRPDSDAVFAITDCHSDVDNCEASLELLRYRANWLSAAEGIIFGSGDVISVAVHVAARAISFYRNGKPLGLLYRSLSPTVLVLFPMVELFNRDSRAKWMQPVNEVALRARYVLRAMLHHFARPMAESILVEQLRRPEEDNVALQLLGCDGAEMAAVYLAPPRAPMLRSVTNVRFLRFAGAFAVVEDDHAGVHTLLGAALEPDFDVALDRALLPTPESPALPRQLLDLALTLVRYERPGTAGKTGSADHTDSYAYKYASRDKAVLTIDRPATFLRLLRVLAESDWGAWRSRPLIASRMKQLVTLLLQVLRLPSLDLPPGTLLCETWNELLWSSSAPVELERSMCYELNDEPGNTGGACGPAITPIHGLNEMPSVGAVYHDATGNSGSNMSGGKYKLYCPTCELPWELCSQAHEPPTSLCVLYDTLLRNRYKASSPYSGFFARWTASKPADKQPAVASAASGTEYATTATSAERGVQIGQEVSRVSQDHEAASVAEYTYGSSLASLPFEQEEGEPHLDEDEDGEEEEMSVTAQAESAEAETSISTHAPPSSEAAERSVRAGPDTAHGTAIEAATTPRVTDDDNNGEEDEEGEVKSAAFVLLRRRHRVSAEDEMMRSIETTVTTASCGVEVEGEGEIEQGCFSLVGRLLSPTRLEARVMFRQSAYAMRDDGGQPQGDWNCPACTFLNSGDTTRCTICATARPGAVWTCIVCNYAYNPMSNNICATCGQLRLRRAMRYAGRDAERYVFCERCHRTDTYVGFNNLRLYAACEQCGCVTRWLPKDKYSGVLRALLVNDGDELELHFTIGGTVLSCTNFFTTSYTAAGLRRQLKSIAASASSEQDLSFARYVAPLVQRAADYAPDAIPRDPVRRVDISGDTSLVTPLRPSSCLLSAIGYYASRLVLLWGRAVMRRVFEDATVLQRLRVHDVAWLNDFAELPSPAASRVFRECLRTLFRAHGYVGPGAVQAVAAVGQVLAKTHEALRAQRCYLLYALCWYACQEPSESIRTACYRAMTSLLEDCMGDTSTSRLALHPHCLGPALRLRPIVAGQQRAMIYGLLHRVALHSVATGTMAMSALLIALHCMECGSPLPSLFSLDLSEAWPYVVLLSSTRLSSKGQLLVGQVRGSVGVAPTAGGKYYFEVVLPSNFGEPGNSAASSGTNATVVIGWGTLQHEHLSSVQHVGSDMHSWGFNCRDRLRIMMEEQQVPITQRPGPGDVIGTLLNLDTKMMSWSINGEELIWVSVPAQGESEMIYPYVSAALEGDGVEVRLAETHFRPAGYADYSPPAQSMLFGQTSATLAVQGRSFAFYEQLCNLLDAAGAGELRLRSALQSTLRSATVRRMVPQYPALTAAIHSSTSVIDDVTDSELDTLLPYVVHLNAISDLAVMVVRNYDTVRNSAYLEQRFHAVRDLLFADARWALFVNQEGGRPVFSTQQPRIVRIDLDTARLALEGQDEMRALRLSVTGQLFAQLERAPIYTNATMFTVRLTDDVTNDAGGVTRSIISTIGEELNYRVVQGRRAEPALPLTRLCAHSTVFTVVPNMAFFYRTARSAELTRDRATSRSAMDAEGGEEGGRVAQRMFTWLGMLMGNVVLCGTLKLTLNFPRLVWKFLTYDTVTMADYYYDIDDQIRGSLDDEEFLRNDAFFYAALGSAVADSPTSSRAAHNATAPGEESGSGAIAAMRTRPGSAFVTSTGGATVESGSVTPWSQRPFWAMTPAVSRQDLFALAAATATTNAAATTSMSGGGNSAGGPGSAHGLPALAHNPWLTTSDAAAPPRHSPEATAGSRTLSTGPGPGNAARAGSSANLFFDVNVQQRREQLEEALLHQFDPALLALRGGLTSVVPADLLRSIRWDDLQTRVCGRACMSADDVLACMDLAAVPVVLRDMLRQVLDEMTMRERSQFVLFCSGQSRLPLPEKVHVTCGDEPQQLPTAHTCSPISLRLQPCNSATELRAKLMICLSHAKQFGFV